MAAGDPRPEILRLRQSDPEPLRQRLGIGLGRGRDLVFSSIRGHLLQHPPDQRHLTTFLMAYNFAKRLKTLRGLTPHEYVCKVWTENPERFRLNPLHHTAGLNT